MDVSRVPMRLLGLGPNFGCNSVCLQGLVLNVAAFSSLII